MSSVLEAKGVYKSYQEGNNKIDVLQNVSLKVNTGEHLAILGSSGSGKSTLLHILGALDKADAGEVNVLGQDILSLNETEKAQFRNQNMGFVYQFHHLLGEFDALENVAMPLLIGKASVSSAQAKAKQMLDRVGLAHRIKHRPGQLSGGERQRVAIARALVSSPKLVLADEPTGNLDNKTSESIYALISELKQDFQTSFVIVTHDRGLASRLDRSVEIANGCILENG